MRIVVEFQADGLLRVSTGSEQHIVTEAHFRFDGPIPVMDLSHALVAVNEKPCDQGNPEFYMDGKTPKPRL